MSSDARVPKFAGGFASIDSAMFDAALVGLSLSDAQALVRAAGWEVRVVQDESGGSGLLTLDRAANRLNVAVADGVITGVMYNG